MSTLSHPNIVKFIGAKATPPDLFIVLEWMARGSLSSILLDFSQEISWSQRVHWAQDVAKGIEYLHSLRPKIIHRDLRSDNVMVHEDMTAKVTEFGLSRRKRFAMRASPRRSVDEEAKKILAGVHDAGKGKEEKKKEDDKYAFVSEGGPAYTAPELMTGKAYTEKVDAYNFGILLWQIMCRQIPHREKKPLQIAEGVVNDNLRPHVPDYLPKEVSSLMNECWEAEDEKRPTFEAIVAALQKISDSNMEIDLPEDVETSASESSRRDSVSAEGNNASNSNN